MEYFLERIARELRNEFGNNLRKHCLVFPGRRAGLYMLKYLSSGLQKPVWAPSTYTINELFRSLSSLQPAGNELLLFELFRIYSSIRKEPGSFDDFYFWGDMLINDFDDTDKYLASASSLFENIRDLKEIDTKFGGFTEEQKEIIKRFWFNFDFSKPTVQKSDFISLWAVMFDLYTGFRKRLREQNLAYEGMIFRDVAEMNESELLPLLRWDMIHFIGFNALNNCEKRLLSVLRKAGRARFYWDYDNSYIGKGKFNSAGFFLTDNVRIFGNDMPSDWNYNTLLSDPAIKRNVLETSSDVAQVKLVPELLAQIPSLNPGNAHHTAIVLSDESLLIPLMSSLPENFADINITMGYPLRQSAVYNLLRNLMDLQRTARERNGMTFFYSDHIVNILRNPLFQGILNEADAKKAKEILHIDRYWINSDTFKSSSFLSGIFTKHPHPLSLSSWFRDILSLISLKQFSDEDTTQAGIRNELIYRIVLSLNRLDPITGDPVVKLSGETYLKLLDRLIRTQSVPFSGEPLSGIQIMGILETRALDFTNLVVLSVNEGVMPALSSTSSFIPLSLRQAFGLPSINHQESLYAYHFYRLLHRAENVTLLYNSNSEGLRSGEMSRFLTQMKYDSNLLPEFRVATSEIRTPSVPDEKIERTAKHSELLRSRFLSDKDKILSPSAINTWLNCRMKFCYRYVYGIYEPDTLTEEIDSAVFGNILHSVMKKLYSEYSGKVITSGILDNFLKNTDHLRRLIDESIRSEMRNGETGPASVNEFIVRDVLYSFARRILYADRTITPITILSLEEYVHFDLEATSGEQKILVKTGGYADRIDIVNGITRIVDYKTGIINDSACSVDELFANDRTKDLDGWLQILLYCEAFGRISRNNKLNPSIYKIRKMTGRAVQSSLIIKEGRSETVTDDYSVVRDQFTAGLVKTVSGIFNPAESFTMTRDTAKCRYCPYRSLCSR
ncbi:MAG TPA: PD-(D/E)XK nuclease family protein [Bacteroidales bacterium]|nr:PD-(D/E)XK nuclease family protein [Bacteroidales bacterium]